MPSTYLWTALDYKLEQAFANMIIDIESGSEAQDFDDYFEMEVDTDSGHDDGYVGDNEKANKKRKRTKIVKWLRRH
jgi:hypothetical protein